MYKYDGMVEFVYSPEILTTILFYQESVISSRLEGTVATITDILNYKVGKDVSEKIEGDVTEIENYKDALGYCVKEAERNNFEVSNSLIKSIQFIILNNSRGTDKLKGIVDIEEKGSGQSPSIYRFRDLYSMVEEISE